ncbi:MAG: C_GCAxxG_C_C family protein [Planctomycetes bacterium]|nr:C_GCAxxG_C_C family protein [Planctomycetota bacterium]
MSTKSEEAVGRFKKGFNCSQAVFGTFSEQFGLDCEQASKVATGFGGGMRMGGTCGVVTGAFMVLSLKYGNSTAKDKDGKAKTYKKIEEFTNRFKNRNSSVTCRELLDCDISTPEGMKEAQSKGLFSSTCPRMVQDAVEILEEMLNE